MKSPARVIAGYGAECLVETPDGQLVSCKSRRSAGRPVCGDLVSFSRDVARGAVIDAIEPRENSFPRADRSGRKRIVAANLDQIIIVVAPRPQPTRDLVNRYLVAAHSVAIPAAICVNKSDLIATGDQRWEEMAHLYRTLDYRFCRSNIREDEGLQELERLLARGTSILVGQSGVGKSSLINRLVPDLSLRTRAISNSTGKGRHTTTASTLYHLAGGGDVVDSPGVWEYGIWNMSNAEIARGFVEFAPYLGDCRFADCRHLVEPGCAIEGAAQRGEIATARLESYRRIATVSGAGQL